MWDMNEFGWWLMVQILQVTNEEKKHYVKNIFVYFLL